LRIEKLAASLADKNKAVLGSSAHPDTSGRATVPAVVALSCCGFHTSHAAADETSFTILADFQKK
jgi:hypothetical protein